MDSFFLFLVDDPIFLDWKCAFCLFVSEIFESAFQFSGHEGKELGLWFYLAGLAEFFPRYTKILKKTDNLHLQFEENLLGFNFEQPFKSLAFVGADIPQAVQLILQILIGDELLQSCNQSLAFAAQLPDSEFLCFVLSSETLNGFGWITFKEYGSSAILIQA